MALPAERRASWGPSLVRTWGRTMSTISGVGIRVTDRAKQTLSNREPRILTFNHSSSLDLLVGAAVLPEGGVLIVKEELRSMPLIGAACSALGSVFLERTNRDRAYAALEKVAERIHREDLQIMIAPEGTRSDDGNLGRFKLGAFRIAQIARVPIVPIVMHGHARIWPRGQLAPNLGTAVVDVLEPTMLQADENLSEAALSLQNRYQQALAAGPEEMRA
ncbi:MAG: hypothetical protein CMH53_00915 [Myxococcales bacterium]|nr:hypothetical protein [Myxococcales bacterium]